MQLLGKAIGVFVIGAGLAAPAFGAGIGLSGPHYNLNIIGVENPKKSDLTGSDRHTIFVGLGRNGTTTSNIYLTPGPFDVCDGNSFDAAYACDGSKVAAQGAVFQLPCDTATQTDTGCPDGVDSASYQIWARALGTPGGTATVTTCATDDTGEVICSTENTVLVRDKGKPTFTNVTKSLTSLNACFDIGGVLTCEDVSLFDPDLVDYFWQYQNTGLRLAQLRFYAD
jgi:hypothetical protein